MQITLVVLTTLGIFLFCLAHYTGFVNIHMWLSNWHKNQALKILERQEQQWERLSRDATYND